MIQLKPEIYPCPKCRVGPGKPCKGRLGGSAVWHFQRRLLAMVALPEEVKTAIHTQWCPTCRVEKGPCEGSDGTWWHRAREYGQIGTPEPKSRVVRILAHPCPDPYCGAEAGERCWTRDKKSYYGSLYEVEPRYSTKFHGERIALGDPKELKPSQEEALGVSCPKCEAKCGEPCWRRTESTGEGAYRWLPRKKWVASQTIHVDRWAVARKQKKAEKK